jgi:hypothetical protein
MSTGFLCACDWPEKHTIYKIPVLGRSGGWNRVEPRVRKDQSDTHKLLDEIGKFGGENANQLGFCRMWIVWLENREKQDFII